MLQETRHIQNLKAQLEKEYDMKDLGEVKKILGTRITRDRGLNKLWLFQENHVLKVLERFNMTEVSPVTTPLAGHFKLSSKQCSQLLKKEQTQAHMLVRWDHSCMLWSTLGMT